MKYIPRQRNPLIPFQFRIGLIFAWFCAGMASVVWAGQPAGLTYEVRWEGLPNAEIRKTLESFSDTVAYRDRPPASVGHLRRRVARDLERFEGILRAEGYYGASVDAPVDISRSPILVTFQVTSGNRYRFGAITVESTPAVGILWPSPEEMGFPPGAPALSRTILAAEPLLLQRARRRGFPFPKVSERSVVIDHASKTVSIAYRIDPGPAASFGPVTVEGLDSVRESTVRRSLAWKEGDRFDASLIAKTQERLYAQELFSIVQIDVGDAVDTAGQVPIIITVAERKHRTVTLGAGFETDGGPMARAGWEHRNIDGLGHRLTLQTDWAGDLQSAEGRFLIPGFRRDDQVLRLRLRIARESPDAYDSTYLNTSAVVERKLGPKWTAGAGVGFRHAREEQKDLDETYHLLSFPVYALRDTTDDPMNPARGMKLTGRVEPFIEVTDPGVSFLKTSFDWSRYFKLDDDGDWIIATRVKLGTILGAGAGDIPPDERFYAGGGGSIRGYGFKTVSPLEEGDPIGGKSLAELSLEVRRRITGDIGMVVFLDGGSSFSPSVPDFSEKLRWGAGVGVRYFTPVGPLRVDVAVPLNRRSGLDDSFGVYVSFGQSF